MKTFEYHYKEIGTYVSKVKMTIEACSQEEADIIAEQYASWKDQTEGVEGDNNNIILLGKEPELETIETDYTSETFENLERK